MARDDDAGPGRFSTLLIASASSAAAAIITSEIWESGRVATAAVTPVVVAFTTEALGRVPVVGGGRRRAERDDPADSTTEQPPAPRRRRRFRPVLALMIGLLAFIVAVVALTIPELAFDKSIAGGGQTTFFTDGPREALRSVIDDPPDWIDDLLRRLEEL